MKTHLSFDPAFKMYVAVGHSVSLREVMNDMLHAEITRGLWWFMCSLVGGVAICFIIFSYCFEKKLQKRVTRPIMELSRQIKNPKEFMAARNKSVDIYTRRSTMGRKTINSGGSRDSMTVDTQGSSTDTDQASARQSDQEGQKARKSTFGEIFGRAFKSSYEKQYEQDTKMSKLKSINEV